MIVYTTDGKLTLALDLYVSCTTFLTAFRNVSNWEIWIVLTGWSCDQILRRYDHVPVNCIAQLIF